MTLANSVFTKAGVAFVALATAFVLAAPAQALTEEEMSAEIDRLTALIETLTSSLGGGSSTTGGGSCASIPAPLTIGAQNADVTALQNFLIGAGQSIPAGATGYFGSQTQAALAGWQAANGVAPAVGYYGPITAAAMAAKCVPTTSDDDMSDDDMSDDDDSSMSLSGEASLDEVTADDADDDTIQEGDEEAPIGIFTVTFVDGDAMITRLDFSLLGDGETDTTTVRPWDAFDTLSLWVDGDMVAEVDTSSKGDYLGDEDNGIVRLSGLNIVAMEDEDVEITVAANIQGGLDAEELTAWNITMESMRFVDGDDVTTTDTTVVDDESAQVTIDEEGTDDDAEIKKDSNTPEEGTLKVDDGSSKETYDVFLFKIDVDDESSDLVLVEAVVDVTVGNPAGNADTTADDVISRVYLTVDGQKVKGDTDSGTADTEISHVIAATESNVLTYTFDFDDYNLDAGDVYEAVLEIEFRGQDGGDYENGVTIDTDVDGADWQLEGAEGDNVLTDTESGEQQTLANVVPIISDVTSSVAADDPNDSGTISFEFTVEADGDDVLLDVADNADVDGATDDVMFTITGSSTPENLAVTAMTLVSGDAVYAGGTWTIDDGDEATFALDTTFTTADAADNGTYRVTLDSVGGVDVDKTSAGMSLSN